MAKSTLSLLVHSLQELQLLSPGQLQQLNRSLHRQFPEAPALCQELARRGWLTAWQAKQLANGRTSDLRLGPYVMLEPLGSGGTGQVFKARHQMMNRVVALKMLRPDMAKDPETVQRFYREIEVISQLSHPNIVHALEAGPIGPALALVTEFVEGVDLDRWVRKSGPMLALQACDCIRQAARGLAHAHERGLVHRDIKPSNLILSKVRPQGDKAETVREGAELGTIKILDLGLARLQQPAKGSTTSNLTMLAGTSVMQGTPDYMSPEQALDFHSADIRSDLYSLGCTLYFLLAGQPPFAGSGLAEKLMKHQQAKPPPLERPDLPDGLTAVLDRLLAKRPEDRYHTPAELSQALTALLAPEKGAGGVLTTPLHQLAGTQRRRGRRMVFGLAGCVALAGLLGLGFMLVRGWSDHTSTPIAVMSSGSGPRTVPTGSSPRTVPSGELVKNISASTKKLFPTTPARIGAVCWIDRGYKIEKLGESLEGGTLIQTAHDDVSDTSEKYLTFDLGAPAVVHVFVDSFGTGLPKWLSDGTWQLSSDTVTVEGQPKAGKVYRKQFAAGRVNLGAGGVAPGLGGSRNYFVIVQPAR